MAEQLQAICSYVFSLAGSLANAAPRRSYTNELNASKSPSYDESSPTPSQSSSPQSSRLEFFNQSTRPKDNIEFPRRLTGPNDPIHLQDTNSKQYKRAAWHYHKMLKNNYIPYDDIDADAKDILDVDALSGITLTVDRTIQCPTNVMKGSFSFSYLGRDKVDENFEFKPDDDNAPVPQADHPISCQLDLNYFSSDSALSFSIDEDRFQARGNLSFGSLLSYNATITSSISGNAADESIMHAFSTSHKGFPLSLKHQSTPGGGRVSMLTAATAFDRFHLGTEAVHVHGNTSYWNFKFGTKIYADPTFKADGSPNPPVGLGEWTITGNTNGDIGGSTCAAIHPALSVAAECNYAANKGDLTWGIAADVDLGNNITFDVGYDDSKHLTIAMDSGFWGIPDLSIGLTLSIDRFLSVTPGLELHYDVTNYVYPIEQL